MVASLLGVGSCVTHLRLWGNTTREENERNKIKMEWKEKEGTRERGIVEIEYGGKW